jgi:hypothetical protein
MEITNAEMPMNGEEEVQYIRNGQVLIVVGDASETVDTLYPVLRVQEDGFAPVVAGPHPADVLFPPGMFQNTTFRSQELQF